tara:strand:+ start:121 stop:252 length:132 start_codon:yes stop_codon:yes gene_type:complete
MPFLIALNAVVATARAVTESIIKICFAYRQIVGKKVLSIREFS